MVIHAILSHQIQMHHIRQKGTTFQISCYWGCVPFFRNSSKYFYQLLLIKEEKKKSKKEGNAEPCSEHSYKKLRKTPSNLLFLKKKKKLWGCVLCISAFLII
jgi:hypothetical protein